MALGGVVVTNPLPTPVPKNNLYLAPAGEVSLYRFDVDQSRLKKQHILYMHNNRGRRVPSDARSHTDTDHVW